MDMYQVFSQLKSREKYINLCHNTIYNLYQFREEVHECQFQTQEGKNRILKLIEEFIEKMNLSKQSLYDDDGVDLKQQCVNELLQCLKEKEIINDKNHLFQIIEKMNYKGENSKKQKQSQSKKYFYWGYKQIGCQFIQIRISIFIATDGRLHGFSNNHKLIKKFLNEQRDFSKINYLKHSGQFLVRFDKKMIIQNNKWESLQTLEGQNDKISSLILSYEEKLIISGSKDKTIRFWKNDNSFWNCQQALITEFQVLSLSLNSDQTKLIICGFLPIILVAEFQLGNNYWVIIQKLKVDIYGEYVNFVYNNQFIFHPYGTGLFQTFNYQNEAKQFIEGKLLFISNRQGRQGSVHYFNNKTKVLILSYDFRIYIYHFQENRDYQLLHQIKIKEENSLRRLLHQNQLLALKTNSKWQSQQFFIQLRSKI